MLLREIIKTVINEYINEYNHNDVTLKKNGGQKDFKKIAQKGIEVNPMKNQDGSEFGFGNLLRDVPGSRYPRENRGNDNFIGDSNLDPNDEMGKEIAYSLSFGNKNYKDKFLFAYGVHRMLYDGEVKTDTDKKILSDICIYLSENPSVLKNDLNSDNVFSDRDWEHGIANFYGLPFSEIKIQYAKDAKKYILQKSKNNVIESNIITSNGYYVYPCYTFSTANSVGSTFKQGMCFFNSPTFWQQHTGDSGALFMFKRINDFEGGEASDSGLYNDNKSYNEIVISTHINENGEVYIDGITNGNNITYYNQDYHPANKLANSATDFNDRDIKITSDILGTINGEEAFEYCISRTKRRQDTKYDDIFKNGNYQLYVNLSNKNPDQKINDEEFGLTLFPNDGKVYCIDHNNKRVFLIEPKGFITCNGREVQNTETPFYQKINEYMPKFFKDWMGFRHNKRNKYVYSESRIRKIIMGVINESLDLRLV